MCSIWISCDPDPPTENKSPSPATLLFPFENAECNEGIQISATKSTVLFEWSSGQNTDWFTLIVTNLHSGEDSTYMSQEEEIPVTLDRGTPYAWRVVSASNSVDETVESETWRFYNAGEPIQSYPPFPAEIISPEMAETVPFANGFVSLNWEGRDVEGDITEYEVYLGTEMSPKLYYEGIETIQLLEVPVDRDSIYFWKVLTKDSQGNSSETPLYQFKVE